MAQQKKLILKQSGAALEAQDEGILVGYANVYNIEDLQGDISAQGSFIKTVAERHKKIKIYRNHWYEKFVGVPLELDAMDKHGLKLTAKLALNTDLGRNTFEETKFMVENGFEVGFSIGGYVVKRDSDNHKIVTEYKLHEVSVLTSDPANQHSFVELVKSIKAEPEQTQKQFWQLIEKAYNEQFTDNILESLEQHLTLKEDPERNVATSHILKPTDIELMIWKQLLNK